MNIKKSIRNILSISKAKKEGLHVKHIARLIINEQINLFTDTSEFNFEEIKKKANAILLQDIKKKNNEFKRVKNQKTKRIRVPVTD